MSESESEYSDSDSEALESQVLHAPPVKKWDQFREVPPAVDTGSAVKNIWWIRGEMFVKLLAYIFSFIFVIVSSVVSKGTMIFMIKQISTGSSNIAFCNTRQNGGQYISDQTRQKQFEVDFSCPDLDSSCQVSRVTERVAWIWAVAFAFSIPQVFSFGRSLRKYLFKFIRLPRFGDFIFVLFMELCQTVGLAILCYLVLPEMDSSAAMILTSSLALVPSLLLMLSRFQEDNDRKNRIQWIRFLIDIPVVVIQLSGAVLWPLIQYMGWGIELFPNHPHPWAIPLGVVLTSCGWWETFTEEDSSNVLGKALWNVKWRMIEKGGCRYATYLMITPLKIGLFMGAMVLINLGTGAIDKPSDLVDYFYESFGEHTYRVAEIVNNGIFEEVFESGVVQLTQYTINDPGRHVLWILLIQVLTGLVAYISAKFAAKVWIQTFGFALPITCVTPVCLGFVLSLCGARAADKCAFDSNAFYIPNRLFFDCPALGSLISYSWESEIWLFLLWFISYIWITIHVWYSKSPRLASTEQIFGSPFYDGIFIDQSLMLNRRKDGIKTLKAEDIVFKEEEELGFDKAEYLSFPEKSTASHSKSSIKASDSVTRIYACATMWHESEEEMMEMLKSLFRIDSDYSARRLSQKYLGIVDPDYYEWETHILFDDCMEIGGPENEQICNKFVKQLVDMMDIAGSRHFGRKIRVKPCKKYPTPYGGRLVWTLPGKTKIVCHLKDKAKIRHKKRWSQIMYMYYLLGYKLMELPISDERKEVMAENTYLLALDGDVDFQPDAAIRLIDLMKKNKGVGAACGRIHPTGSGYMPMYQTFEYAVGHWLQKATEHVLGCVLCSPGCFSMFRGKAIMDDNVMRKYTTVAKHARQHIQFDQGEDRWLCTLLLQRGWRVEYSAASDSYTACPEAFEEFYNQRRRWMPSTILNIWDLLQGWRSITKLNEDISWLYIVYQMGIMIGTFIGPGGIYMALAGAVSKVFGVQALYSLIYNAIPLLLFCIACYYTDSKFQLALAKLMTIGYTLIMLAVYIGLVVEIAQKGFLSATAISAYSFFVPLVLAGMLHFEEAYCFPYIGVYLITIPSMYVLLVLYSFFNLWNVSWGTREVAQKKSKADLEREKKEEAERLAELKKKKKEGLVGTLLDQFNLGGDKGETASVDFSLGNVLRCMCFSHDDPLEPKKQLVKISASIDQVSKRLNQIESRSGISGAGMGRRKSSLRSKHSLGSIAEPMDGSNHEEDDHHSDESDSEHESEQNVIERNDDTNPYWIEDEDLKKGPVDYLPGTEINFWRDLIEKYLKPLEMTKKEKDDQAKELKDYRDTIIFTFLMINLLYVVLVSMLQVQASLTIEWTPFESLDVGRQDGVIFYLSYVKPDSDSISPLIQITRDTDTLDMLGLFFLITFSSITLAQVIGMLFHRWQTLSHYIASTKLDFFGNKDEAAETSSVNKNMVNITRQLQNPDTEKEDEDGEKGLANRRQTIAQLTSYHKKVKGQSGEEINLEKQFKKRWENMDLTNQNDPMIRRLSTRRDTLHALKVRRNSYMTARKSVAFAEPKSSFSSASFVNEGYDQGDSDFADDFTDFSGSLNSGRNSTQFDYSIGESRL